MEWKIRESSRGFYAEYGRYIQSGIEVGFKQGFYMPGFHVSESSRFDTREQAEKYIASRQQFIPSLPVMQGEKKEYGQIY